VAKLLKTPHAGLRLQHLNVTIAGENDISH